MAALVRIVTYSDRAFRRRFVYRAGKPPREIDITGAHLVMKLRRRAEDQNALLVLTSQNGGIQIVPGSGGAFVVYISAAQALELAPGTYVHSLIITMPSGVPQGLWDGALVHKPGASR